ISIIKSIWTYGVELFGSTKPSNSSRERREWGSSVAGHSASNAKGPSLSECYFAGKGAAVVLPPHERLLPSPSWPAPAATGSDIQAHLQSMFYLLRPEETLKMDPRHVEFKCKRFEKRRRISLGSQTTDDGAKFLQSMNKDNTRDLIKQTILTIIRYCSRSNESPPPGDSSHSTGHGHRVLSGESRRQWKIHQES
ncbi:unnamed protein product, partial [Nezara viridula]